MIDFDIISRRCEMSRRALQRERGWVEFKGLQYAEPYMTRSELVRTIHTFFFESGYSVKDILGGGLYVEFSQTLKPGHPEHGDDLLGLIQIYWIDPVGFKADIVVYVRKHSHRGKFVNTLFHELDHVLWYFEKGEFDDSEVEYSKRAHEIRARRVGAELSRRLSEASS